MTGLYQLLPWRTEPVDVTRRRHRLGVGEAARGPLEVPGFWATGVDGDPARRSSAGAESWTQAS